MSLFLFDKSENLIKTIAPEACLESMQDANANSTIYHTINIQFSDDLKDVVYFGTHDIDKPNEFLMYKIVNQESQAKRMRMNGIHVFFDDIKADGVIKDYRPTNQQAQTVLTQLLTGSRWTPGISTATKVASGSFYFKKRLDAFWDFLNVWGVEFRLRMTFSGGKITGRYVDIADTYAPYQGKWYEIGDKVLTLLAEEDRSNVYTAFLGRGKGEESGDGFGRRITFENVVWSTANGDPVDKPAGQDYVEIPWATALYGYPDGKPRVDVVEYTDIDDPGVLLQKTYADGILNCVPKRQFEASVMSQEVAELGEIVTLIDDNIGVRYQTRIIRLQRDFLNRKRKVFEFGEKIVRSQSERMRRDKEDTIKRIDEQKSLLEAVRATITDAYWGTDGYNYDLEAGNEYGLAGGLYSFNAPIDQYPTEVIYVGAGRMLIASSKDPTGQWEWRTGATGEGFHGDALVTNSVTANKLASDVGQSLDLLSNHAITMLVSDVNENKDDITQLGTSQAATNDSLSQQITNLSAQTQLLDDRFSIDFSRLSSRVTDTETDIEERKANITFNTDEDFNPQIVMGQADKPKQLIVNPETGVTITDNGVNVFEASDQQVFTTRLVVLQSINFGNHVAVKYGTDFTIFNAIGGA